MVKAEQFLSSLSFLSICQENIKKTFGDSNFNANK